MSSASASLSPPPPDASRENELSGQLKSTKRLLTLKQFELNTVLDLAKGITEQEYTEDGLYQMLTLTLQGQRRIGRALLFAAEASGHFVVRLNLRAGGMVLGGARLELPPAVAAQPTDWWMPLAGLALAPATWGEFEGVVPIIQQDQPVAYLFVGGLAADLDRAELARFLAPLVNMLMGAVENRRLTLQRIAGAATRKEIEIAQQVQQQMFPRHLPNDADLSVACTYVPHTEIGGDYYDVVAVDADRLLLCVADVSGKGVPASLLMSNFQAGLRTLLRQGADLATIVPELNHLLYENSGGEKFITAFFGLYYRATRRLQFVNAGHNDPLLLDDQGRVQPLKDGTVMLGIIEPLPMLAVGEVQVPPRSLLFLYTDGLTEVFDGAGREFGEEGVLDTLRGHRYLPLARLHDTLMEKIEAFGEGAGKFADDVTLVSCRFR